MKTWNWLFFLEFCLLGSNKDKILVGEVKSPFYFGRFAGHYRRNGVSAF